MVQHGEVGTEVKEGYPSGARVLRHHTGGMRLRAQEQKQEDRRRNRNRA